LAFKATVVIMGNTIIPFLVEFLDVKAWYRKYKKWSFRRKTSNDIPILKT